MIDTQAEAFAQAQRTAPTARRRILAALEAHGPMTPDELADLLGMPQGTARPRCTELHRDGLVVDTGQRRPTVHGCRAIVWGIGAPPLDSQLELPLDG